MLGFATTLRTARSTQIKLALDAGTGPGTIDLMDGTRPATGAAITTQVILATFTLPSPAGGNASGVFTVGTVADTVGLGEAGAGKTATWGRMKDGDGVFVTDCSVSVTDGGGDITCNSTTIASGQVVKFTGGTITEGNV